MKRMKANPGSGRWRISPLGKPLLALVASSLWSSVLLCCFEACGQPHPSEWDRAMMGANLGTVSVEARSISEAWKNISTTFLFRSVLVPSGEPTDTGQFRLDQAGCTGMDVVKAIVSSYPQYQYVIDAEYQIVWIFPKKLVYHEILSQKLKVRETIKGMPMFSGLLESIGKNPKACVATRGISDIFRNTFDYPVDVPAGEYSVRQLLNLACVANPCQSFVISATANNCYLVTPVNLVSDDTTKAPPIGSIVLWNLFIAQTAKPPGLSQINVTLADPDPLKRWAARTYLNANAWSISFDELVSSAPAGTNAIWSALGVLGVIARSDKATHSASVQRLQAELTDQFLVSGDPKLALLGATELAVRGGGSKALDIAIQRKIENAEIQNVSDELAPLARRSIFARQLILKRQPAWLNADLALSRAFMAKPIFE